jgi:hypothetical protein
MNTDRVFHGEQGRDCTRSLNESAATDDEATALVTRATPENYCLSSFRRATSTKLRRVLAAQPFSRGITPGTSIIAGMQPALGRATPHIMPGEPAAI